MHFFIKYSVQILVTIACFVSSSAWAVTQDISHAQLAEMKATKPDMILLDVRTPREYAQGHIEGAINIPHNNIRAIIERVKKDDTVVLYCRTGRRVGLVTDFLEQRGYTKLHHLEGDMRKWMAEKKPVVIPD